MRIFFQSYYRLDREEFEPPIYDVKSFLLHPVEDFVFSIRMDVGEESDPEILCIATIIERPSSEVAQILRDPSSANFDVSDYEGLKGFPSSYRVFVRAVRNRIDQLSTDTLSTLLWRNGITGGPLQLQSELTSLRWHESDQPINAFEFLPDQIPSGILLIGLSDMQKILAIDKNLFKDNNLTGAPLPHILLREAWRNSNAHLRSSLVLAVAAAETGVKTTITDLAPNTSWLFEKLQSPPIELIIRDYIHTLPVRNHINGHVLRPPKTIITTVKRAVELRNKIVHGRSARITPNELQSMLLAIRDLLYLLDYYSGVSWALEHISPEVLQQLKDSAPGKS